MQRCDRCGGETRATVMSKFNHDVVCVSCKQDEREAPGYAAADKAEIEAVRAGIRNYPGIGLSAANKAFLAERRAAR